MHCPSLKELPPSPPGRSGWPWTEESPQIPGTMIEGKPWPKISIVTPSYNQAQFLEETIRSVLLQGYPKLEYIIMDGGSKDGSVDIIRKYEQWLSSWVSEPDNGQSDAINKGWSMAGGEILAWLNSDDTYEMNALKTAAEFLTNHAEVDMVYGDCSIINENSIFEKKCPTIDFDLGSLVCNIWFIPQQSSFIRRKVVKSVGEIRTDLHLVMDWELWLRIAMKEFKIYYLPHTLANFRIWVNAKTSSQSVRSGEEKIKVLNNYFETADILPKIQLFKNKAYSNVHRFSGVAYFGNNHMKKALFHLLTSIRYCPSRLKEKDIIKMLIIALIGKSWIRRFKRGIHICRRVLGYSIQ